MENCVVIGSRSAGRAAGSAAVRAKGAAGGVMKSFPQYVQTAETRVVDLTPDGVDALPVLGEHKYKQAGGGTRPHIHPGMIEIICCRRGANLAFDSKGQTVRFPPGTVFVAQPETPHFLRRYPKSLSTVWIWFRLPKKGESVLGLSPEETAWLVGRLRKMPVRFDASDAVKQSFRRLWHLYDTAPHGTIERRLTLRHAAMCLLIDLVESSSEKKADTSSVRFEALVEEMRRDPSRACNLDELAGRAAMSVAKLTVCFRRHTGLPPHAFLMFCRIAKAKELLTGTDRSIGSIARELGYSSAQHFATQFRRETGQAPYEWRKAHA